MPQEYISMIRVNKGFILFVIGFFCFSLLLGGNLPFYIFYSSFIVLAASYLYIKALRRFFSVEVVCDDTVLTAGSSTNVLTKVNFGLALPVPYVEIRSSDFIAGRYEHSCFIRDTAWDENIWIENEMHFYQRGFHKLDSIYVRTADLFRITAFEERVNTGISIKVYPRVYNVKPLTLGGIDIYREAADLKSSSEDQHTIRDVRKYREGDSLKKVHWKLSAKQDELYVKNLDTISGEEVLLFIDMKNSNYTYDDNGAVEESIIDFSASIVYQIIRKNLSIKVFLNTTPSRQFELSDKPGFDKFMDFLVSQKSDGNQELYQYIYENSFKLHRMNKIAVVTAELDGSLTDALIKMASSGYLISVFYCVDNEVQRSYSEALSKAQVECCYYEEFIDA
jgi:uncharacterized protein (DUF58 family)